MSESTSRAFEDAAKEHGYSLNRIAVNGEPMHYMPETQAFLHGWTASRISTRREDAQRLRDRAHELESNPRCETDRMIVTELRSLAAEMEKRA